MTQNRLTQLFAEEMVVATLVPWPCPSSFGPDDRYQLQEVVSSTAHSLVYRATDLRLSSDGFEATVAIKVHHTEAIAARTEAALQRRIRHPNVLSVLDRGIADNGLEYTVTEYVDGTTLADRERPKQIRDTVRLMEKIARGIQAAHTAGVSHLDLKPANILLSPEGEPKIADFGLSRLTPDPQSSERFSPGRGNLAFMSPEQFHGLDSNHAPASDIYALGGLLYWLLSGTFPNGIMEEEIGRAHRDPNITRRPPCRDRTLSAICDRALLHDPTKRHYSAGEFADDLLAWLERRPIGWMRPTWARVGGLWVSRHKVAASLLLITALGTASGGAGAAWAWDQRVDTERHEQQLQILSEKRARELAERKVETMKADMRKSLRTFANTMFARSPVNLPSTLVWLTWLSDTLLVHEDGNHAPPEEIETILEGIVADKCATGASASMECLMARHALAFVCIQRDDEVGARLQLKAIRTTWNGIVPPSDPIWKDVAALEQCAVAINRTGESTVRDQEDARATLRQWATKAEADGPIDRLAQDVLRRIAKGNTH